LTCFLSEYSIVAWTALRVVKQGDSVYSLCGRWADMGTTETAKRMIGPARKLLLRVLLVAACVVVVCALSLKIYLNSSHAPVLISRMLTDYLRQPVRVAALRTDGGVFSLMGVALVNPPGALPGNLCEVDTIAIAPNWGGILIGKPSLRLLSLAGLRIDLRKNNAGVWNFTELQRVLASKKPSAKELLIVQFIVKGGSILINGQGARGLSLQLSNLTTKGSNAAGVKLSFEDTVRNRYTLTGKARPGKDPALDLMLSAPSLSLNGLAGMLKLKNSALLSSSSASLRMTATLHAGRLEVRGGVDFNRVPLALIKKTPSVTGKLELAAGYDSSTDQARLEALSLTLNDLVAAHASGTVDKMRTERRFRVDLGINQVDLATLAFLLPEAEQGKTAFGGTLSSIGIHLAGDNKGGLTSATGTFMLRGASLKRDGQFLFTGLTTPLSISKVSSGFLARGKLSQEGTVDTGLLEDLDAPFDITFSNRFKLIKARIPALTAKVMGLAVAGRLGFEPVAVNPFSTALHISVASFSQVPLIVEKPDLKIGAGSGSLSLEAVGRGVQDFSATAAIRLAAVQGTRGATRFGVKNGLIDARLIRNRGKLSIGGDTRLSGLNLNDKTGDARFSCHFADEIVQVRDAKFLFDGASVTIARLTSRLPTQESSGGTVRYPLSVDISGGVIHRRQGDVNGFSGALRGSLFSDPRGRWLEGTADIATAQVSWEGKPLGSPKAHLIFSRTGGRGELGGALLGGALNGAIAFKPFAPREGGTFAVRIKGGQMAQMGNLLPRRGTATLSGGALDATCSGNYSAADGLTCRFEASGSGIAASGSGSKTLFSGGGLNVTGVISRNKLEIGKALLKAGSGVVLTASGELTNPFLPRRDGRFVFSLPQTLLNDLIDPFVNMLPRFIQEATVNGSLASEGTFVLHDGRQLLEGVLRFKNALLDVPSQKVKVTGINGSFPISLNLSGGTPAQIRETASFTRENYPYLLKQLSKTPGAGQAITIGGVSFGPLNLGETKLTVNAANGVTTIVSLRSSLFEGALFGTGYVAVQKGLTYRVDLLVNGLSLKLFCASIPKIKDYISGRVDGVISLNGAGKGLAGLTGFTELWAREGGGEKMLVSKVFLQKLSGKKLSGFFFRDDRTFDQAEISADLEDGFLTFETLDISNTNFFGVRDLSVTIAPSQNRIALDHLFNSIKQAATRGKAATGENVAEPPAEPEFKWQE